MKKKGRRIFLRFIVSGIAVIFLIIWKMLTDSYIFQQRQRKRIFPFSKNKPVTFSEGVIVVNKGEKTMVFSAKCSHLGCEINRFENGKLICPCHGSEYDLDGKAVKGPAYKNLEILPSEIINSGTQIEIES